MDLLVTPKRFVLSERVRVTTLVVLLPLGLLKFECPERSETDRSQRCRTRRGHVFVTVRDTKKSLPEITASDSRDIFC